MACVNKKNAHGPYGLCAQLNRDYQRMQNGSQLMLSQHLKSHFQFISKYPVNV